jgi:Fe2+ transport system protein FeoA
MVPLSSLYPGESGLIMNIDEGLYTCKLLCLGLVPKARVTLVRKSPLGDAYYIKIENHQMAVRKSEANTIFIQKLP